MRIKLTNLETILHVTIPNMHSRAIEIKNNNIGVSSSLTSSNNPKEIHMISQELDKIASQIDNIQSSSIDGQRQHQHVWTEIKVLKKKCSHEIVKVMRFVDDMPETM